MLNQHLSDLPMKSATGLAEVRAIGVRPGTGAVRPTAHQLLVCNEERRGPGNLGIPLRLFRVTLKDPEVIV